MTWEQQPLHLLRNYVSVRVGNVMWNELNEYGKPETATVGDAARVSDEEFLSWVNVGVVSLKNFREGIAAFKRDYGDEK